MKTIRSLLLIAAITPVLPGTSGCSKNQPAATAAGKVTAGAKGVANDVQSAASDSWDRIKDYTIDRQADFSAGVDRMAGQLDEKTREIKAKFAGAPDAASRDRARAIEEYDQARAELTSSLGDLGQATAQTWAGAKAKVGQAWRRVQAASHRLTSGAGA